MPATAETLAAALPHVLSAPRDETVVDLLCFRPDFGLRQFPDQLEVTVAGGIPDERWLKYPWLKLPDGRPDPSIQISILPSRVLDQVWLDRAGTVHPGDTILADLDTSIQNLPTDSLLQIGSAVVRVSSEFNNGCVKWKARYGQAALDWITDPAHHAFRLRGLLCAVHQDGSFAVGDPLRVIRRGA